MKLSISCGQCGILEAVTPECGWLLVSNCDRALWESSKKVSWNRIRQGIAGKTDS